MGQRHKDGGGKSMNEQEKIYKTMRGTGVSNIVLGVIVLVTGITAGVLIIVNGARLLKRKSSVMI